MDYPRIAACAQRQVPLLTALVLNLSFSLPAAAADALLLDTVWRSAQQHFPGIVEQKAWQSAANEQREIALGAFDLTVNNDGYGRASGFYDGSTTSTLLSKRFKDSNVQVYGGYRHSRGEFPVYEDELATNRAGEAKIGARFALLRDRRLDPWRLALQAADLDAADARLSVDFTRFEVQRRATKAYRRWAAAGFRLAVYENLMSIADERNTAFESRVRSGDAAPVLLVENQRNLLRRQSLMVDAQRQLGEAAEALSMYLRDTNGKPSAPGAAALPPEWRVPDRIDKGEFDRISDKTLRLRPDLRALDIEIDRQRQELALARNRLAPRLDVELELARDFGNGSPTREGTDTILSLNFEMPIGMRAQKAGARAAKSRLQALEQKRRLALETAHVEIRQLQTKLHNYHRVIELAVAAEQQNKLLEQAENERFNQGASDFFLLNLREENTAEAQIQRIDAKERYLLAEVDYWTATANASELGLTPYLTR